MKKEETSRYYRLANILRSLSPEQKLIAAIIKRAIEDADMHPTQPVPENHVGTGYDNALKLYWQKLRDKNSAQQFLNNKDGFYEELLSLFGCDFDVSEVIDKIREK